MNHTSNSYATFSQKGLTLIADIKSVQSRIDRCVEEAGELGIKSPVGENETEIAYLGRLVATATERKHDLLKREAMDDLAAVQRGEKAVAPQSFIGRKLNALARFAG